MYFMNHYYDETLGATGEPEMTTKQMDASLN